MKNYFLLLLFCSNFYVGAQNVVIPDVNFKAYLVKNSKINTNGDNEIQITEAESFNGGISCPNKNIKDLTGIEMFKKLKRLYCYSNQITSLDVSKNTALEVLNCYDNKLSELDLSKNTLLTYLHCENNKLTSLNIKNGSNNKLETALLYNNPSLTCIQVDENMVPLTCNKSKYKGWCKGLETNYSINCK